MIKRTGDVILLTIIDNTGTNTFSHTIVSTSNVGQYGRLLITFDGDPFATSPPANSGLSGQYIALTFGATSSGLTPNNFSSGINSYSYAIRNTSGSNVSNSTPYQFYVDAPLTPGVTSATVTSVTTSGSFTPQYVSGVPRLLVNTPLTVLVDIINIVTEFYDPVQVAALSGTGITSATYSATNTDITTMFAAPSTPYGVSISSTINSTPTYVADSVITCYAYNSQRTQSSGTIAGSSVGTISVDTLSLSLNETTLRVDSGSGQYPLNPPTNVGNAFASTTSLTTSGNEELQLLGGLFVYPAATDYTGYEPVGPDYSSITGGSYNGFRWITQNIPAASLANNPFINAVITLDAVNVTLSSFITNFFGTGSGGTFIDCYWRGVTSAMGEVTAWASAMLAYAPPGSNPIPFVDGEPTFDAGTGLSNTGSNIMIPIVFNNTDGGVSIPSGGFIQIRYGIQVGPYPDVVLRVREYKD